MTKGNLELQLLLQGSVEDIHRAVASIRRDVGTRRHIIGQADATLIAGTPHENIRAMVEAATA